MELKEFKQLLSESECEDIRRGVAKIEREGQTFYVVYDYDQLEAKRKRAYALKMNVLAPLAQMVNDAP